MLRCLAIESPINATDTLRVVLVLKDGLYLSLWRVPCLGTGSGFVPDQPDTEIIEAAA